MIFSKSPDWVEWVLVSMMLAACAVLISTIYEFTLPSRDRHLRRCLESGRPYEDCFNIYNQELLRRCELSGGSEKDCYRIHVLEEAHKLRYEQAND